MNTYNFNDDVFKTTDLYKNFIANNPSTGFLRIRAYGASGALPISNLKIIVSKTIDNSNIIFFEGTTNESGIIDKIILPTPKLNQNDEITPNSITYDITANYKGEEMANIYKVNMYENIYVIQTINVVPDLNVFAGDI